MHTGDGRRRGRSRPRLLYWFRTPPGVRIGRSALDESAIRLIEEHNPDIEFDWTRILKGQDAPVEQKGPAPQDRRMKPRPREFTPAPRTARPPIATPPPAEQIVDSPQNVFEPSPDAIDAPLETSAEFTAGAESATHIVDGSEPLGHPHIPSDSIDEAAIDELLSDTIPAPLQLAQTIAPATPAEARLGSEGLSRLRARHAEVLARISEAVTDPVRREELKSQAERLNPDTWVTGAEVAQGLEAYETVFESLRTVVGRRGRRRRRSGRPQRQTGSAPPQHIDSSPDTAGGEEGGGETDAQDAGEDL